MGSYGISRELTKSEIVPPAMGFMRFKNQINSGLPMLLFGSVRLLIEFESSSLCAYLGLFVYLVLQKKALSMSTSSSIEAINEEELDEADDEGWEVLQNPQIEIERKFIVPDNYHERLTAQGFQLQQEFDEVLVDKYYDTHEHDLIKEDHWLRQRNGDWELKYPVGLDGHKQGSTLYHETTCIEEIMTRLRPILKVEESCSLLQNLLEKTYLKPFAQLETKRKCYSREDKVNIVIDSTDWGHSVGEIEIMVMDHDHITEATSKIETIGAELEFQNVTTGKLHDYCKKFNQPAY